MVEIIVSKLLLNICSYLAADTKPRQLILNLTTQKMPHKNRDLNNKPSCHGGRAITVHLFLCQGHLRHRHQRHSPGQSLLLHPGLRQGQDLSRTFLPAAGPCAPDQRLQRQGR